MKIRASITLLAGCCLLSTGCHRGAAIPSDSFRLTVQHIITERDVVVSLLKIQVHHSGCISIDGPDTHGMVVLSDSPADRDTQIALSASRVARQGDDSSYIQTFSRVRVGGADGGFSSGPAVHAVPAATKLETYFSSSVTDGDYKLDAPVEIARLDGKPVMLVVGKPTK